jgi:collagen type III alpha
MRFTLIAAAALAALGLAQLAAAQDDQPRRPDPAELFNRLDANQDGTVSADEVPEGQRRLLERILKAGDKDQDGKLTKEEFVAGVEAGREQAREPRPDQPRPDQPRPDQPRPDFNPEAFFKRLDSNGDGKITMDDEVPERAREFVARADADKDGAVTKEEFAKLPRPGQPAQPGRPQPGRPQPGAALFTALDADGDGRISTLELAEATKVLEKLDRNKDEMISREEALGGGERTASDTRPTDRPSDRPGQGDSKRFLASIDKNGDGKIGKDEAPERLKENFDRVDANGDGQLDGEELMRVLNRLRQGGGDAPGDAKPGDAKRPQPEK